MNLKAKKLSLRAALSTHEQTWQAAPLTTTTYTERSFPKTDNTLVSRIGWTRGVQRFGNGFIFVFVLGFCFGTVAASASCVLPALQGPWLCILNMQQPHAARTIKHLEMVATAGQQ